MHSNWMASLDLLLGRINFCQDNTSENPRLKKGWDDLTEDVEVSCERSHYVTIIRLSNIVKGGNSSWDGISSHKSKDTNHSKTSIVDFKCGNDGEYLPLGICRHGIPLGLRAQVGRWK